MKYQNKKNGKVAEVIELNEKYKTVMLEYEGGKTQSITTSTFKRWWKKVDEEETYTKEVMKQKEDLRVEVPDIDPKKVAIVADDSDFVQFVIKTATDMGYGIKHAEGSKWVVLTSGVRPKGVVEVYCGKRIVRLYMKSAVLPESVDYKPTKNYYLDATTSFVYDSKVKKTVKQFLSYSI